MASRKGNRVARIEAQIMTLREQLQRAKVSERERRQRELMALIDRAGMADEVRLAAQHRIDENGGRDAAQ